MDIGVIKFCPEELIVLVPHCSDIRQWGKVINGYNSYPISFTKNVFTAICTDSGISTATYGINVQGLKGYTAYVSVADDSFWGYGLFIGI